MTNKLGREIWQAFEVVDKTHKELINLKKNFREILEEKLLETNENIRLIPMNDTQAVKNGWCFYSDLLEDFGYKKWDPDENELNVNSPFWSFQIDEGNKKNKKFDHLIISLFTILFWPDESLTKEYKSIPQISVAISDLTERNLDKMEDAEAFWMLSAGLKLDDDLQVEIDNRSENGFEIFEFRVKDDEEDRLLYPKSIKGFIQPLINISDEKRLSELLIEPLLRLIA